MFVVLVFLVDEWIADAGYPEFNKFLAKTQRREEFKNDLYDLTANDAKIAKKTKNLCGLRCRIVLFTTEDTEGTEKARLFNFVPFIYSWLINFEIACVPLLVGDLIYRRKQALAHSISTVRQYHPAGIGT